MTKTQKNVPSKVISNIEWDNTTYFKLDDLYFADTEDILEISSGTNLLTPPSTYIKSFNENAKCSKNVNIYTSPLGSSELRNALKLYESMILGEDAFTENDLCVTAGAADALRLVFKNIYISGYRRVLVLGPQYPIIYQNIVNNGLEFTSLIGSGENGFLPSPSEVKSVISEYDCIFVTQPNNPSGEIYSKHDLIELVDIVKSADVLLVYEKIGFDFSNPNCECQNYFEITNRLRPGMYFIVDSLSKRRPVSGLRLGYLIAEKRVINKYIVYERFGDCPSPIGTIGAVLDLIYSSILFSRKNDIQIKKNKYLDMLNEFLKPQSEELIMIHHLELEGIYEQVNKNMKLVDFYLSDFMIGKTKCMGGSNYLIKLKKSNNISEFDFCKQMFLKCGVAAYPLSCFTVTDISNNSAIWIRMSVAMPHSQFKEILTCVKEYLEGMIL